MDIFYSTRAGGRYPTRAGGRYILPQQVGDAENLFLSNEADQNLKEKLYSHK